MGLNDSEQMGCTLMNMYVCHDERNERLKFFYKYVQLVRHISNKITNKIVYLVLYTFACYYYFCNILGKFMMFST